MPGKNFFFFFWSHSKTFFFLSESLQNIFFFGVTPKHFFFGVTPKHIFFLEALQNIFFFGVTPNQLQKLLKVFWSPIFGVNSKRFKKIFGVHAKDDSKWPSKWPLKVFGVDYYLHSRHTKTTKNHKKQHFTNTIITKNDTQVLSASLWSTSASHMLCICHPLRCPGGGDC